MDTLRSYPMTAILMEEGFDASHRGKMYHSPWRSDRNRSLKIDDTLHKFVDFGDTDTDHKKGDSPFSGGDTLDFVGIIKHGRVFSKLSPTHQAEVLSYLAEKVNLIHLPSRDAGKISSTASGPLRGYVNHSGGAVGADSFWGEEGSKHGIISEHYYHGRRTPQGNHEITDAEFLEGRRMVLRANETLERQPDRYMDLLARNWMQVKNAEAVFAVGRFSSGTSSTVDGGTGWAVQMAVDSGKPVYLFDQDMMAWFEHSPDTSGEEGIHPGWRKMDRVPTLTRDFAGIGSRNLTDAGREAIRAVVSATAEAAKAKGRELCDRSLPPVNVWAGSDENAALSNMAERPFSVGAHRFVSVEQYYQWQKAVFARDGDAAAAILSATSGPEMKRIGRSVLGLDPAAWDAVSRDVMKHGMLLSFLSNPDAAYALLETGSAPITHTQEHGRWKDDFPMTLMEVRAMLLDGVDGDISAYKGVGDYVVEEARDGVSWAPLRDYITGERCIRADVAAKYCFEVKVRRDGDEASKAFIAIGFRNRSGGYELRKEPFVGADGVRRDGLKQCTTKDITLIDSSGKNLSGGVSPTSDRVLVFEGFMDFLSYLSWNGVLRPGVDCVILNSVSMYRPALPVLEAYKTVVCYLDNDKAGSDATVEIAKALRKEAAAKGGTVSVLDGRGAYEGFNDINEAWQAECRSRREGEDMSY